MCFVNFSNHPSADWSAEQTEAAKKWGRIVDVKFPSVPPEGTREQVHEMAKTAAAEIISHHPAAVMCQGEFTLTYQVVTLLKEAGITAVSACARRNVIELKQTDGTTRKTSVFEFVGFREY